MLAAALVSLVVGVSVRFPRERRLLERARKIADVRGWWSSEPVIVDYRWVSDTVLFTGTGEWRLESPFLYDIRSHRKTDMPRLSQLLKRDTDVGADRWELSPDGQWLLWVLDLCSDVRAARLDGSGFQIVPLPPPTDTVREIGWQDDKGHWIARGFDYTTRKSIKVVGGDVNRPGQRRLLPLSEGERCFETDTLEVDEQKNLVVVRLAADSVAHPKSRTITLHPPTATRIVEVLSSNRGDRLAWVVLSTQTPPLLQWSRRVFLHDNAPHPSVAIWVSGLDGAEMHEVGHLALGAGVDDDEQPRHLRWLPSDSRLSFVYNKALWTVPIE
jgi:hypothetical protein